MSLAYFEPGERYSIGYYILQQILMESSLNHLIAIFDACGRVLRYPHDATNIAISDYSWTVRRKVDELISDSNSSIFRLFVGNHDMSPPSTQSCSSMQILHRLKFLSPHF